MFYAYLCNCIQAERERLLSSVGNMEVSKQSGIVSNIDPSGTQGSSFEQLPSLSAWAARVYHSLGNGDK